MPSNISFLESARDYHDGTIVNVHDSKVLGLASHTPTIYPSSNAYTYHEAWMPDTHRNPLPHPFTAANNGQLSLTANSIAAIGGTVGAIPILRNTQTGTGNGDAYTAYDGEEEYAMARKLPSSGYTDDVIWEVSTHVRRMVPGNNYFPTEVPNSATIRAELYIFVMNNSYNVIYTNSRFVTNGSTTLQSPSTDKYFYYTRSTDVGYNAWTELKMFVKFPIDTNINFISMRVDNDTRGAQMAFSNTRLQPHNLSFDKILGSNEGASNQNLSSFEA